MTVMKKVLIFVPLYCVWVVVAVNLVFGLCTACLDTGPLQLLSIGGYLVLIMIPMWLFIRWVNAVPRWIKQVEANGIQATATILSVKNTGVVINNTVAVVKLEMRVEPPHDAPFEVSQEKEISMITGLGSYSPGASFSVKYDPENHNHIVILSDPDAISDERARSDGAVADAHNSRPDVTQELAELSQLHKSGELTDTEFAAAKKKLLD